MNRPDFFLIVTRLYVVMHYSQLQNFTYEPRIGFIIPEFKTEWHYDKNKKRPKVRCEIKNTSNETNNSADNQTYRFKSM